MRAILVLLLLGFRTSAPGVHLGYPRDHAARGSEAEHRCSQDQHPQYREHPRPSTSSSSTGILGPHEHQPSADLGEGLLPPPAASPLSVCVLYAHEDGGRGPLALGCILALITKPKSGELADESCDCGEGRAGGKNSSSSMLCCRAVIGKRAQTAEQERAREGAKGEARESQSSFRAACASSANGVGGEVASGFVTVSAQHKCGLFHNRLSERETTRAPRKPVSGPPGEGEAELEGENSHDVG